jgi:hypothetical protein
VDTDLRASLVAATAAAVLSALVGIISGVGVVALLLRAVLGGVLFGALFYGAMFLARSYLPGLSLGAEKPEAYRSEEEGRGGAVDIVLPEEGPEGEFAAGTFREDTRREEARREEPAGPLEPRTLETVAAASHTDTAPAQHSAIAGTGRPFDQEGEPEELGSLIGPEETDEPAAALPLAAAPGLSSFDDLDVLPDLDGFSDSFAPAEFHNGAAESSVSAAPRAASSRGASGSLRTESLDPASLAQAVRTILKRDQKG